MAIPLQSGSKYSAPFVLGLGVLLVACAPTRPRPGGGGGGGDGGGGSMDGGMASSCAPGVRVACSGGTASFCADDGSVMRTEDCGASGQQCVADLGCVTCAPSSYRCDGQDLLQCASDGSGFMVKQTCGAGTTCSDSLGTCTDPCAEAASSNSYLGCDYWAVPTLNSQLAEEFDYALVVANPQAVDVDVTVTRGGSTVRTATVPAGGIATISLPWIPELKGMLGEEASVLVRGAAYRLRSTAPVTVYQFNPLEYRIPRDCAHENPLLNPPDMQCFSFTNDASLLLPVHVLRGDYIGLARPTMKTEISDGFSSRTNSSPSYLTIVGAGDAMVDVNVTFGADVVASGDGQVRAFQRGQNGSFQLGPGDVLQLVAAAPSGCTPVATDTTMPDPFTNVTINYCRSGARFDLTGTRIAASGPVAVFGGHNCAFVPSNRWACDHLEEQLFPLEAWGKEFVVGVTKPLRGEPNLVRIVSGADGNSITFEPASVHAALTLNAGEMVEFAASEHFVVRGSQALAVAQFLVGQDYDGLGSSGEMAEGDPAMALAIPSEQYRDSYIFLSPESFPRSFVNVVAKAGATVTLDGSPVSGFRPVGSSGWQVAQVELSRSGSHTIEGSDGFGIVVYGFGTYTSYMYPGGLDLKVINPLI